MTTFGERVKDTRIALKLNQVEFSKALGISRQAISNIECNKSIMAISNLQKLSDLYNVNLNWLVSGNGSMFNNTNNDDTKHYLIGLKEKFNLSDDDIDGLLELLNSGGSRDMVLKLVQVKKGNKEALENLIKNLTAVRSFM